MSVAKGIKALVKESCIDLGGKSACDDGVCSKRCSLLATNGEYADESPSLSIIFFLTARKFVRNHNNKIL